jgi:hypothetical protein
MPSVAPKGSPYTNSIVTCVFKDGVNRTPSILYSHNPAFYLLAVARAR